MTDPEAEALTCESAAALIGREVMLNVVEKVPTNPFLDSPKGHTEPPESPVRSSHIIFTCILSVMCYSSAPVGSLYASFHGLIPSS